MIFVATARDDDDLLQWRSRRTRPWRVHGALDSLSAAAPPSPRFAVAVHGHDLTRQCGTPQYVAPEIIKGETCVFIYLLIYLFI